MCAAAYVPMFGDRALFNAICEADTTSTYEDGLSVGSWVGLGAHPQKIARPT